MAKNVVHPGVLVREECLKPLGMTVSAAAEHLGVARKTLSELVNGSSRLTQDMAVRLTKAFGGDLSMWMGLQFQYDLAHAQDLAKHIHVRRIPRERVAA